MWHSPRLLRQQVVLSRMGMSAVGESRGLKRPLDDAASVAQECGPSPEAAAGAGACSYYAPSRRRTGASSDGDRHARRPMEMRCRCPWTCFIARSSFTSGSEIGWCTAAASTVPQLNASLVISSLDCCGPDFGHSARAPCRARLGSDACQALYSTNRRVRTCVHVSETWYLVSVSRRVLLCRGHCQVHIV